MPGGPAKHVCARSVRFFWQSEIDLAYTDLTSPRAATKLSYIIGTRRSDGYCCSASGHTRAAGDTTAGSPFRPLFFFGHGVIDAGHGFCGLRTDLLSRRSVPSAPAVAHHS